MLAELIARETIDVYLQSTVYDVIKEGDAVRGLLLATNEGPLALTARITVDATATLSCRIWPAPRSRRGATTD